MSVFQRFSIISDVECSVWTGGYRWTYCFRRGDYRTALGGWHSSTAWGMQCWRSMT